MTKSGDTTPSPRKNDRSHLRRQKPDDFAEVIIALGYAATRKHYKACSEAVNRWKETLTDEETERYEAAVKARLLANATKGGHARKALRVSTPRQKAPKRQPHFNNRVPGSDLLPQAPGGTVARAITHLRQKGYRPVFDCGRVYGKALAGIYVAGQHKLDAPGILALAAKHGFDSDEWKRLA